MDAGIADTINRKIAEGVAEHLDLIDWLKGVEKTGEPRWYEPPMVDQFLTAVPVSTQAWLFGMIAHAARRSTYDVYDEIPAGADYEMMFAALRVEILKRRDTETPRGDAAEARIAEVV